MRRTVRPSGSIPDGPGKTAGIEIGEDVAARILTLRASDGAAAAVDAPYTPGDRPGDWNPTPPAFLPALDPGWGSVQPFFLRHASQFRPAPPPALNSCRYARDFNEIKAIGSIDSVTRSQDQTDLARFWIATAAQNWNPVAREVAVAQGLTLSQNARAFALLNLAGADAFIAAWDAKFAYSQWRPVTAIRAADADGNPATDADPLWTPLLVTPPLSRLHRRPHHLRRRGAEGPRTRVRQASRASSSSSPASQRRASSKPTRPSKTSPMASSMPACGGNPLENVERARSFCRRGDRPLRRASPSPGPTSRGRSRRPRASAHRVG